MHCFGSSQYLGLAWLEANGQPGRRRECRLWPFASNHVKFSQEDFSKELRCAIRCPVAAVIGALADTPNLLDLVYRIVMSRTNIEIDDALVRKARKLTRLKTKRQIVDRALELLVRSEARKALLRHYGTGIWKGDVKASRRNRV